jgi:cytochrome c oxidase assembly factor CtaG
MKKSSNILLVVSSLAVVGVLGYLLMKQLKDTQKVKTTTDAEFAKYLAKEKESKRIANRTLEEMRADFEKYGM